MNSGILSLALRCAAALLALGSSHAQAQSATYLVRPGDSILSIADALRPPPATMNQMALALVRANLPSFQTRTTLQPPVGTRLSVPEPAAVLATDANTAEAEFGRIWRADQHYLAARALEKNGDMFHAFSTYVYAAKLGHGQAQMRLGQLYDSDFSGFVKHDLQESINWYEKARQNEVAVPKTTPRTPGTRR